MACNAGSPLYALSAHKCCSMSSGRSMMISSNTISSCVESCLFAPVTTIESGTPRPSTSRWRLLPFFPPVGRVSTNCLKGKRSFDHGAIDAFPAPGDTLHRIIFGKSGAPEGNKEAGSHPVHEMCVDGARTAKTFFGQRLPLAACSQNIKNSLKNLLGRHRLSASAGLSFVGLIRIPYYSRYQGFNPFPKGIRNFPRLNLCHIPSGVKLLPPEEI